MERLTTNVISPDGPLSSDICLIGEAPGAEENTRLIPFIGSAGQLLNDSLRISGMARGMILVHNVFTQQPPKNNVAHYFQDKSGTKLNWEGEEHVARLKEWLGRLLELRKTGAGGPNVIGALGAKAMLVLTGKKRITKWRGTVLPCTLVPGFKVYPMYHPSFVLRIMNEPEERVNSAQKKMDRQNALPLFLKDLERLKIQSESPDITRPERQFEIVNDLPQALSLLDSCMNVEAVACDIETLPSEDGPILWCIGFSTRPDHAFCIPILKEQKFFWSKKEEARIWRKISDLFLSPVKKIFHNGLYDLSILGRYYGLRCATGTFEDTMYGHQMNYPYLRKGLDLCVSIYTWEPYYKDEGKVHLGKRSSDTEEFIYNCRDCACTREIWPIIVRDGLELGTAGNYRITKEVTPSLLHMQIRGVKIDELKKGFLTIDFAKKSNEYEQRIQVLAKNPKLNVRSSTQLKSLLYADLDCKAQYNHKTGKLTTDKDAISRLSKVYNSPGDPRHQILTLLLLFRKFSKLSDTYTKMKVGSNGRIHTSYGWVTTFRLNSSKSHFGGGGNLQNIPVRSDEGREIRRLFIADEGKILIASDLAQAEAREVAWAAKDKRLIDLFNKGWDVHWARTKSIFSFDEDIVYEPKAKISDVYTGDAHSMKFYRSLGKTIVHAGNYMMGPRMLQAILVREGVHLPEKICKQLLHSNRNNNPLITRWQQDTIEKVKRDRTLITPLGDKRVFRGRLNNSLFRSAIAFVPQSTVGRILQLAQKEILDKCPKVELLLNVHDETICQVDKDDESIEKAILQIRSAMERPHVTGGEDITIPCDFKLGYNWGDLGEYVE